MDSEKPIIDQIVSLLEERTRGTQIAIYSIAGAGLAFAIHRIRPISKFSRAADIPKHFLEQKEPLRGRIVGCKANKKNITLLFDHRPLVRIPLWHSGKEPLPVQLWGVRPVGNLTSSWLHSVAYDLRATVVPVQRGEDGLLYARVRLDWPRLPCEDLPTNKSKKHRKAEPLESIDVAERVVEVGMGAVAEDVSVSSSSSDAYVWYVPWLRSDNFAQVLKQAQGRAVHRRAGYWHEVIPPSRIEKAMRMIKSLVPNVSNKSKPKVAVQ